MINLWKTNTVVFVQCAFYYTFIDDNNFDKSHTYEVVPYQYPLDNITNDLYDLILYLA